MTWYRTGTVAVTNGSTAVAGTGTTWVGTVLARQGIVLPDGRLYEIAQVNSNSSLTLAAPYLGSTASGQSYAVAPVRGPELALSQQIAAMVAQYGAAFEGAGQGLFPDGTAAVPRLRFSADSNTGLRRSGADALSVVTGGADRLTVNNAGAVLTGLLSGTAVVSNDADVTAGRLLTTGAGAAQAFRRGNVLGAVSQAGGEPTGALIETGSNANGDYDRFADGTQICHQRIDLSSTDFTTALGSTGFFAAALQTWTYPAAFSAGPRVIGNVERPVDTVVGLVSLRSAPSSTAATFIPALSQSVNTTATRRVHLMAMGRWF